MAHNKWTHVPDGCDLAEEYDAGGHTYKTLGDKYDCPREIVAGRINKYRESIGQHGGRHQPSPPRRFSFQ